MFKTRAQTTPAISLCVLALGALFFLAPGVGAVPNVTYEVLIPSENGEVEVDHLVIRGGTQEEIGYELGMTGIEKFNAILLPYEDPIYGRAKEEYIRLHDPVLFERIKGVKRAYGLKEDDYSLDPSGLFYMYISTSCSAIYLPPSSTENGHAMGGKNLDWSYDPEGNESADIAAGGIESLLSDPTVFESVLRNRIHVVELYPDDGYATLTLGGSDLENGVSDGINEMGLAVSALQDGDTYTDPIASMAGGTTSGLNFLQMLRSILENCVTVEEAKEHVLINRISMPYIGNHFLIYDRSGNATVIEFSNSSREAIFTDYSSTPVPLTNYAIHLRPDYTKLVPENPKDPHDDYSRMIRLHNYIDAHEGLYNETDIWNAMSLVEANGNASKEGVLTCGTVRLMYTIVTDLDERTLTAKFYLRDGPVSDPVMGTNELVLSDPFDFRLER